MDLNNYTEQKVNVSMSFAQAVASWPAPNYIDPVTRGDGIVVVSAVFGSLATIAIALRAYSRLWITRTFGTDDVLILLAWVGVHGQIYL